jgi:hypothetical protein
LLLVSLQRSWLLLPLLLLLQDLPCEPCQMVLLLLLLLVLAFVAVLCFHCLSGLLSFQLKLWKRAQSQQTLVRVQLVQVCRLEQ